MLYFKSLPLGLAACIALGAAIPVHGKPANGTPTMQSAQHLQDYTPSSRLRWLSGTNEEVSP